MVLPAKHSQTATILASLDVTNHARQACKVSYLILNATEVRQISELIAGIFGTRNQIVLRDFLNTAAVWGQELPRRVRQHLYEFKLNQRYEAMCVRGFPLDDKALGPTPSAHRFGGQVEVVGRNEIIHVLYASLLGEAFAWTTIQNSHIINDVMPLTDDINIVSSSGSASKFDFHTEDAFHRYAGDYLGLMCFRNPDRVGTVLSNILPGDLSTHTIEALFEERYYVGANVAQEVPSVKSLSPVLFGNKTFPYLRINLNNISTLPGDNEAIEALEALKAVLNKNATVVVFEPGDCWYIDNLRVAHGRWPFKARFDGTDRWLKRLYISSSFRQSTAYRATPGARTLNPLGVAN
jgi:TfdA family taurine catabolism dioxygenase TauD